MKKKVTILFADIRDFSVLVETLPSDKVIPYLNEFLSLMIDIILENHGHLDKFLGDGLMAEFGAHSDDPSQEKHAVEAAIAMQNALFFLNQDFEKRKLPKMEIVIGIHTGEAIIGNIGSKKHTEYTAIGDAVNIASRIEMAAKQHNTPILASEATLLSTHNQFQTEELPPLHLKNKPHPLKIFSVLL